MKTCPRCYNKYENDIKICPNCHYRLSAEDIAGSPADVKEAKKTDTPPKNVKPQKQKTSNLRVVIIIFAVIAAMFVIILAASNITSRSSAPAPRGQASNSSGNASNAANSDNAIDDDDVIPDVTEEPTASEETPETGPAGRETTVSLDGGTIYFAPKIRDLTNLLALLAQDDTAAIEQMQADGTVYVLQENTKVIEVNSTGTAILINVQEGELAGMLGYVVRAAVN